MVLKNLRIADLFVFFLATGITVAFTVGIYDNNSGITRFVIQGSTENWVYNLDQTAQITVPGPLGNTIVEIKNETARIVSSPCINQICVSSGVVRIGPARNQWVACLPNAVLIRVEGVSRYSEHEELDGVVW